MTVSGTNTFNQVRNQIIELALARLGIKTFGRGLTPQDITQGSTVLNSMVKSWKNSGRHLWKTAEGTLFLAVGQAAYVLDGTTANATEDYSETATTADITSGTTVIPVADTSGFVVGYNIGILQNDFTLHWSTITNIASLNITIADAITVNVDSNQAVYAYETKIKRPESVDSLRLKRNPGNEVPCVYLSRDTYFNIPVKYIAGSPNQYYYDKQLTYGTLYLWPTPNDASQTAKFTYQKQFFDFDTPTNDPDFPNEWIKTLYLNLAVDLAGFYGKADPNFMAILKAEAADSWTMAEGYDREDTSFYIQPATNTNVNTYR